MSFELRTCCCCIPLRKGLLVWGYLRLLADLLSIAAFLGLIISPKLRRSEFYTSADKSTLRSLEIYTSGIEAELGLIDIALAITFIVGTHKKNSTVLKVFYYYQWVILVLQIILYVAFVALEAIAIFDRRSVHNRPGSNELELEFASQIIGFIIGILVQVYLLVLVNSLIKKFERAKQQPQQGIIYQSS